MAYSFVSSSSQHLRANSSPLGTGQLGDHTIAFWAKSSGAGGQTLFSLSRSTETTGSNNPTVLIQMNSVRLRYFLRANISSGGVGFIDLPGTASSSTAFNNQWNHCACRLVDSTTVSTATSWINGSLGEQATLGSAIPATTGMDRLGICALVRGNVLSYATASMCEIGVWSTSLSNDEILALSKAVSPSMIRPQSLVFYSPLIREIIDKKNGLAISNVNSATISDHPRIYI